MKKTAQEHANWPKLLVIGFMYMAQTFPSGFAAGLMPTLYREQGLDLEKFWIFSLATIPYWLRWLIAPVVDAYWSPKIGPRRSWFIPCTIVAVLAYMSLALFEPTEQFLVIIVAILCLKSVFTAAQEVAIDAYVVDNVTTNERPKAAALNTIFEAAGQFAALAGLAIIYQQYGWQIAVCVAALLMLLFLTPAFLRKEHVSEAQLLRAKQTREGGGAALMAPLKRFFARPDSYLIIPFVLAGGLYTGLMFPMIGPFLIDRGFEVSQIGFMVGIILLAATFSGSITAATLVNKLGEKTMMALMVLAIAPFSAPIIAAAALDIELTVWTAIAVAFPPFYIMAVFYVVFVNLRLGYASATQAGTDYSISSAISRIGQTIAAAISGIIASKMAWEGFFAITIGFGILAMGLCWLTNEKLQRLIESRNAKELSAS